MPVEHGHIGLHTTDGMIALLNVLLTIQENQQLLHHKLDAMQKELDELKLMIRATRSDIEHNRRQCSGAGNSVALAP